MRVTIDGNQAAVDVAYRLNELCAIYPITPSLDDGRAGRRVGQPRPHQRVGHRAHRRGDAERGRRGRRDARRPPGRGAERDVHGIPGPAADDPQHVQDRRRADLDGVPRGRALARGPGAVDLRRPLRRDGGAADRFRAAVVGVGAGGPRPRARRAGGDAAHPGAVRALLRRLPHLARAQHRRADRRRRAARRRARAPGARAPVPRRSRPSAPSCAAPPRTPTSTSRPARR